MSKQYAFLLAESTEMRKRLKQMSKQYAFLLAESIEMRKRLRQMSKQYAFLLIEIEFIYFSDAVISYGDRQNLTFKMGITEYSSFFEAKISWGRF